MKNCKIFKPGGIISIPALFLTALLLFGTSIVNTTKAQAAILVALFGDKIASESASD